jgi:lipopolysaccharide/colanic/teichoic acid biosynthesis glycosyltransferase
MNGVEERLGHLVLKRLTDLTFSLVMSVLALPVMALASLAAAAAGLETWAFALIALIALLWRVPLREPAAD